MKAKSSAHYQREFRRRLREQGLVKKEVWIRPEHAKHLALVEKQLREANGSQWIKGVMSMTNKTNLWTTTSLHTALQEMDLFTNGAASLELIDGIEPSLHIVMHEFGDLPVFLTVSGDQIIVESILWSVDDVADVVKFNDAVLRTHKYFPLSTISLDATSSGSDYYQMFGALSSTSILSNVIFEIETLATNVIHATEAYSEFLTIPVEA
ncbi:DUF2170 family protein [Exilibacterium tricleocarpae]|uniref:DUF2170 family protein n=1 Tax=Exilibacterium tricleocarpae TaxID=2591008 RepID=A0A545TFH4_9GAMM|nr:YjfI family protein [Exilibacterium tricleocarpae]TQV75984.1 DUF2170 family protein [Exilibacterium tricleocarpae]